MHDDTIELRQPTDDPKVLRAFLQPIAIAFGDDYTDEMFEIDRQLFELDRLVGAVDGETWVAGASGESRRLTVPGGAEIRAAAISGVGVLPTHRRRGILTRLMSWLLDQAAERGEAVSVLHASEGAIYPHFGYGHGDAPGLDRRRALGVPVQPAGRAARAACASSTSTRGCEPSRRSSIRSAPAGPARCRAHRTSGGSSSWPTTAGGAPAWARSRTPSCTSDGEPRGYALYRVKADWGDRGPNNTLNVLEVTALDPAAERALWEWLVGIDLVGRVKAWRTPVQNPLLLQVAEPQRLGLTIRDGIWLRIVDLPAALEARTYAAPGRVTLEVTDAFIPSNAGRWTVDVLGDRGVASVAAAAAGVEPDLALDIADLATIYLGAFTFADLARAGRAPRVP